LSSILLKSCARHCEVCPGPRTVVATCGLLVRQQRSALLFVLLPRRSDEDLRLLACEVSRRLSTRAETLSACTSWLVRTGRSCCDSREEEQKASEQKEQEKSGVLACKDGLPLGVPLPPLGGKPLPLTLEREGTMPTPVEPTAWGSPNKDSRPGTFARLSSPGMLASEPGVKPRLARAEAKAGSPAAGAAGAGGAVAAGPAP